MRERLSKSSQLCITQPPRKSTGYYLSLSLSSLRRMIRSRGQNARSRLTSILYGRIKFKNCSLYVSGTRSRVLSEAGGVRAPQLPLGQDTPTRLDVIGVRGGPDRGPRPAAPHHQISHKRLSPLNIYTPLKISKLGFKSLKYRLVKEPNDIIDFVRYLSYSYHHPLPSPPQPPHIVKSGVFSGRQGYYCVYSSLIN